MWLTDGSEEHTRRRTCFCLSPLILVFLALSAASGVSLVHLPPSSLHRHLRIHVHPPLLFTCEILHCHSIFQKRKLGSALPGGNESFFLA